jgi:hypothetical protein
MKISSFYKGESFKELWFCHIRFGVLLTRPIRLLGGFVVAWATDVFRAQVDRWINPTSLAAQF